MSININDYVEELKEIDNMYMSEEDKNYYLFHKYVDIFSRIKEDDFDQFLTAVLQYFQGKQYSIFCEYILFVDGKTKFPMKEIENNNTATKSLNVIDFYNKYDEQLLIFLKGCMFIENCLIRLLVKKGEKTDITLYKKITKAHSLGLISDKTKDLLIEIKNIRNNIAHALFYRLDFNELFDLVVCSSEAGVIYSDECIWKNRKLSFEFYGIEGLLNDLFPNTFSMLIDYNKDLFLMKNTANYCYSKLN